VDRTHRLFRSVVPLNDRYRRLGSLAREVRRTTDRYTQLVNVFPAMGGGWVDIARTMAPEPQGVATAAP